ncbi:MAG: M23 family metallopeptidase [Patescibacteria group bacterium]
MNSKETYIVLFLIAISLFGVFLFKYNTQKNSAPSSSVDQLPAQDNVFRDQNISEISVASKNGFGVPLDRTSEKITKKPFGIYITPATSPVQPEKFQGYHAGTDFEIFPEELNINVPVKAVCSGKLLLKEYASGYGGVAVESCELNGNPITVIYGHLKLASITSKIDGNLNAGDTIGILGRDKSIETDGERKHLHLGFHKGTAINIKGYVASQSELSGWIDPCLYVC